MNVTYLPFTLFPTPFKRSNFENAFDLQVHINDLIYNLASSPSILEKAFEKYFKIDQLYFCYQNLKIWFKFNI
jgi:hypothetical protein